MLEFDYINDDFLRRAIISWLAGFKCINTRSNYSRDLHYFLNFILKNYVTSNNNFSDNTQIDRHYSSNHTEVSSEVWSSDNANMTEINISLINTLSLHQYRQWLLSLQEKNLCARSRTRIVSSVKNFHKNLISKGLMTNQAIFSLKYPRVPKLLPKNVDTEIIDNICEYIDGSMQYSHRWIMLRDRLIIAMLYTTGLRISELLSIRISDINRYYNKVKVIGKGNRARVTPIMDYIIIMISEYKKECPYIDESNCFNDWLFFNTKGGKLSRNSFANCIAKLRQNSGAPKKLSAHSLRHSFATHLLNNGANLRYIQDLLGHANLNSTEIYTKVSTKKLFDSYINANPRIINDCIDSTKKYCK